MGVGRHWQTVAQPIAAVSSFFREPSDAIAATLRKLRRFMRIVSGRS